MNKRDVEKAKKAIENITMSKPKNPKIIIEDNTVYAYDGDLFRFSMPLKTWNKLNGKQEANADTAE